MSYWTLKTLWLQKIIVQGSNFTNLTWNGFPRRGRWIHCSQNFHCRGRYTAPMIQHCQQCQQGCPPWRRIHLPQWLVIMQISFAITLNAAAAIRRSRDTFFTGRCDGRSLPQWVYWANCLLNVSDTWLNRAQVKGYRGASPLTQVMATQLCSFAQTFWQSSGLRTWKYKTINEYVERWYVENNI